MKILLQFLFCVLLTQFGVKGVSLPKGIEKCSLSDPKLNECMGKGFIDGIKSFANGNTEFGIPSLEPFEIKQMELQADPEKAFKLNQKYTNMKFTKLIESSMESFKMNLDEKDCTFDMVVFTPFSNMESDYEMTGQAMVFPINGHGRCNVTLYDVRNHHHADCDMYTKKGKKILRFKTYTMDMQAGGAHYDFPNLMPGNEQISNELSKVINENALEIFKDVKGGFEEILSKIHLSGANAILSKIPMDELFLK